MPESGVSAARLMMRVQPDLGHPGVPAPASVPGADRVGGLSLEAVPAAMALSQPTGVQAQGGCALLGLGSSASLEDCCLVWGHPPSFGGVSAFGSFFWTWGDC